MRDMDTIVSLAKRRGFIFQSSEIYGGLASTYDYGPLGVELKRNIKDIWWRTFVHQRDDIVGLDTAILMSPEVWVASGHAAGFADPLIECKNCHHRFRSDHVWVLEKDRSDKSAKKTDNDPHLLTIIASTEQEALDIVWQQLSKKDQKEYDENGPKFHPFGFEEYNDKSQVSCPECDIQGSLSNPRQFNLMFKTFLGPVEEEASQAYLRPETAQGIFVNFQNVLNSTRRKLPFGIAQIGKSFRNEITVGNFIFRTREFEQMELEYFIFPGDDDDAFKIWISDCLNFFTNLGIPAQNLRIRPHDTDELSHYSKATSDIEYAFPWGWGEIQGIANRTDFDLTAHSQHSGNRLDYFDEQSGKHIIPYVIEPAAGVDRILLTFLIDAYTEEEVITPAGKTETRIVLKLNPTIAPVKVAILPLSRNDRLVPKAREVYKLVQNHFVCQYDDAQSIGRRYRRQDEIGTPLCITVDFETIDASSGIETVTIRDRDTMKQTRVPISKLIASINDHLTS
ncbi:MAG: glycine--tRNA ligase [SAR202 cluster bacterium Io17-Chloro-G3]|nr:MAG: glycine--tRNA ligase [SAR202 cluster bacterium Io17-Chloro-G3]